ncbi:MAG: flagellar biosynthesis protein FlhF [Clostridia bacterium]|nr:flagellar biosynthesis protein FlhF [Clostridia bacterium]
MIVKRYLAGSMPEAMEKIKRDLGPEAVILSTRQVPAEGWRRFFGFRKLEVTAALEEVAATKNEEFDLHKEVQELRQLVTELRKETLLQPQSGHGSPFMGSPWGELLSKMEIEGELKERLVAQLGEPGGGREKEALIRQLAGQLAKYTGFTENKVYCFVGPTGVGKTTTLAKLAAHAAVYHGRQTAVITADTYRIGAVDQLRTYADILNVPLEVVMTPSEMKEALRKHQDKDAIFVDTAGRPSCNKEQLAELKEMLAVIPEKTTFLVLSCTTKSSDLLKIAQDFRVAGYHQLIFTKADETSSLGSILSLASQTGCPVAYVTVGQNVPDDIMVAEPEQLATLMVEALA